MKVVLTKFFSPEFLSLYFSDLSHIISLNFIETKYIEELISPKSIDLIINKVDEADIIVTSSIIGTDFIRILLENDARIKKSIYSKKLFCVGKHSADSFHLKMNIVADLYFDSAKSLSDYFSQKNLNFKKILHFCGSLSPKMIDAENYQQIVCYDTILAPHLLPEHSHVAFFSPSGVRSYFINNKYSNQKIFAIGNTTADELDKYLPSQTPIFIAENTTHTLLKLIHGDIYPTS